MFLFICFWILSLHYCVLNGERRYTNTFKCNWIIYILYLFLLLNQEGLSLSCKSLSLRSVWFVRNALKGERCPTGPDDLTAAQRGGTCLYLRCVNVFLSVMVSLRLKGKRSRNTPSNTPGWNCQTCLWLLIAKLSVVRSFWASTSRTKVPEVCVCAPVTAVCSMLRLSQPPHCPLLPQLPSHQCGVVIDSPHAISLWDRDTATGEGAAFT